MSLLETAPVEQDTDESQEVAHIVRKVDQVIGKYVTALCGIKFIVREPDPNKPVCPACESAMKALMAGRGGNN